MIPQVFVAVAFVWVGFTVLGAQPKPTSVPFGTKLASHNGQLDAPVISPDGRWIAVSSQSPSEKSVLITPASGGAFRTLVPASDRPLSVVWFPRGDRVAYMSERVGGVVVVDFNASTGTLRGTPRRVTLERTTQYAISPDGKSLAYISDVADDRMINVVPADGGTAREVLRRPGKGLDNVRFAPDGKSIYFVIRGSHERGSVYRVSTSGGAAELVWQPVQAGGYTVIEPASGRIVRATGEGIVIMTLQGDTILTMTNSSLTGTAVIGTFSSDGHHLYVAPIDVGAVIRAFPLDGGRAVDLSPNTQYFYPVGWSSDSRSVYFTGGESYTLHATNLDGSTRTMKVDSTLQPPMRITSVSSDGRHAFLQERAPAGRTFRAVLYDFQTGKVTKVTDSLGMTVDGRGGDYLKYSHETGEFVFLQRTGGTVATAATLPREIRAVKPGGLNRLVRRVPSSADQAVNFIADGDRVYWTVTRNDTTALFLAKGAAPAVKIWSTGERVRETLLSNDGMKMAVAIAQPPANGFDRVRLQFLRIDAGGKVTADGSSATFGSYWDAYWTPGDQAIVALEFPGSDVDTRLIRIPTNGSAVSYIVKPGATTFWDHYLSPDGKYSVLPAEFTRGASVWRIDLEAAQRDWKQRGGKK